MTTVGSLPLQASHKVYQQPRKSEENCFFVIDLSLVQHQTKEQVIGLRHETEKKCDLQVKVIVDRSQSHKLRYLKQSDRFREFQVTFENLHIHL
jgi:hypothetical protein